MSTFKTNRPARPSIHGSSFSNGSRNESSVNEEISSTIEGSKLLLGELMSRPCLLSLCDGRVFHGLLHCADDSGNVIVRRCFQLPLDSSVEDVTEECVREAPQSIIERFNEVAIRADEDDRKTAMAMNVGSCGENGDGNRSVQVPVDSSVGNATEEGVKEAPRSIIERFNEIAIRADEDDRRTAMDGGSENDCENRGGNECNRGMCSGGKKVIAVKGVDPMRIAKMVDVGGMYFFAEDFDRCNINNKNDTNNGDHGLESGTVIQLRKSPDLGFTVSNALPFISGDADSPQDPSYVGIIVAAKKLRRSIYVLG